jgi:hypothetical protein
MRKEVPATDDDEPQGSPMAASAHAAAGVLVPSGSGAAAPERPTGPAVIAPFVDVPFYLACNADVRAARVDPIEHYFHNGWREGRDPNVWFDTRYYLRNNPDVRASGCNPLWHYVLAGRREQRLPRQPHGPRRDQIDRLPDGNPEPEQPDRTVIGAELSAEALCLRLCTACLGARGLVLSLSHDAYLEKIGGVQLVVGDEQLKFNGDLFVYLHLAPAAPHATLAPVEPPENWLQVAVDGTRIGTATTATLLTMLKQLATIDLARVLVVHSLIGHRPEDVARFAVALRPARSVFWVHDYTTVCESVALLRNDATHCHAPPPDSMACRICVHGKDRRAHLARIQALLDTLPFHFVAPSRFALDKWTGAMVRAYGAMPAAAQGALAHEHCRLVPATPTRGDAAPRTGPVRVGFAGFASFHKGWPFFRDLVMQTRHLDGYAFYHFGAESMVAPLDGVTPVAVSVTATHNTAMTEALAAHGIDLVLVLSLWPETFSLVAHEALAAGADVVALAEGGNIAELVRASGRGVVLPDERALAPFFLSMQAAEYAKRRRAEGNAAVSLAYVGTTVTLDLTEGGGAGTELATTNAPDLRVLCDETVLFAKPEDGCYRFALPPAADNARQRVVRLLSRRCIPAWMYPASTDHRRLGVAVTRVTLDGRPVAANDVRRASGWWPAEAGWQWTDGAAVLRTGTAKTLEVTVMPWLSYWRCRLGPSGGA